MIAFLLCILLFVKVNDSIGVQRKSEAITTFEQQDSGKWESWSAARECNWSPGIFTWGLIKTPLKHSRHILPTEQRQQIMMIRNIGISTSYWQNIPTSPPVHFDVEWQMGYFHLRCSYLLKARSKKRNDCTQSQEFSMFCLVFLEPTSGCAVYNDTFFF